MGAGLLTTEIVLVGLGLLAFTVVVLVYVRRRFISRDHDVVTCGFREKGAFRWRASLLRMSGTSLQVFPMFGVTLRPTHTWERRTLDLEVIAPLEDESGRLGEFLDPRGLGRAVTVSGVGDSGATVRFQLALGAVQYTALRYWVESAPPTPTWAV